MDQQNQSFEEQSRQAKESTYKLKRNMIIVIACMVVFAAVAIPLISLLDRISTGGTEEETHRPPSSIIFATPDYEYDIMQDADYLELDRRIYYFNTKTGETEVVTEQNLASFGPAAAVLVDCINAIIAGDTEAYNALFSQNYYANHKPEPPFTMQRLYDIRLTLRNVSTVSGKNGKYDQYEYDVEYKIRLNDGTYRTDIGHDESKKQFFILSNSTSREVLIDQILDYNYTY